MSEFKPDIERDARLVRAGMEGGFDAVCSMAMTMPDFAGGPDRVTAHGDWLRKQDSTYIDAIIKRIRAMEAA